jgi:hypothetical protein
VELTLNDNEVTVLREMVEKDLHELLMEIANTDARDYRERLKARETLLRDIQQRLERSSQPAAVQ